MIWIHKRRSSFNNSNLSATIYFACSCLLCIAQSASQDDSVIDFQDEYEDDQPSEDSSVTYTTVSAEEETSKIGLDQVYFAPRWEGEGPPNFTDHPNKVYCKKDYWWRYYIERVDPPPPHIYSRYLRWKRSSIDTSNVTTTTNTANVFIGTYEPSNEANDREKPLNGRVGKRSVPNDQIPGMLEPVDNERKNAPQYRRRSRIGIRRRFIKNRLPEATTQFGAISAVYPPVRVKRMINKKKKKKNPMSSMARAQTTTTTRKIKVVTMNPSRRAKIQKQIRLTAIPKRIFTEDEASTTGIWDKLTGLPFYSTTAEWETPTQRTRPKFKYIKAVDPEYVESTEEESKSKSLEAGDESNSSVDVKSETSDEDVGRRTYNTTAPVRTIVQDPPQRRPFKSSIYNAGWVSSPGPDASANELRRYYWKMKQSRRGVDNTNQRGKGRLNFSGNNMVFESTSAIWYNREDSIAARLLAGFWQSYVVGLLFSLVSELQK